jgi:endogenous inhibitor of DNA gyrase (YacG/DUF329 family)
MGPPEDRYSQIMSQAKCPICKRPATRDYTPFCSRRCADVDLQRWLVGSYVVPGREGEGNIKEATVAQGADGRWRLFYEYARSMEDGIAASRIGMAIADRPEGPWQVVEDPFGIRPDAWDNWHLSTGPIFARPGEPPVMFYNGATLDARWRIGWVAFDADFTRVVDRCIEPLIVPPPPKLRSGIDIAFAASCLDRGHVIELYYSLEDRVLRRAALSHFVRR